MKLEHEEITKITQETITYLQNTPFAGKNCSPAPEKEETRKTHTPMDRTCASRLCGEEREVKRNEEAFWRRNGRMVKCG